jgi:pimeloyl-ACP methyl ester carboxylesterase
VKTTKGTVHVGRFEIPYRKYGDSDHMLMCVSGALQTMAIWRTVVKRFAVNFTVVIFDMPGIGRSEIKSGSAHVTVEEQLEALHALIEETHPGGELTLAGASWGTAIAAAYAALNPDAVQHLVLSSFGMKPNAGMKKLVTRAIEVYQGGDYVQGAHLILEMFGNQIGEAYRKQIIAQFESLNDAHAEAFYEHTANIMKLGSLDDVIDLTQIKARTFIINGALDTIIDIEDMYVAERLIPDCEIRLVEGVGHFLHFERPELLDDYAEFMLPTSTRPRNHLATN